MYPSAVSRQRAARADEEVGSLASEARSSLRRVFGTARGLARLGGPEAQSPFRTGGLL